MPIASAISFAIVIVFSFCFAYHIFFSYCSSGSRFLLFFVRISAEGFELNLNSMPFFSVFKVIFNIINYSFINYLFFGYNPDTRQGCFVVIFNDSSGILIIFTITQVFRLNTMLFQTNYSYFAK